MRWQATGGKLSLMINGPIYHYEVTVSEAFNENNGVVYVINKQYGWGGNKARQYGEWKLKIDISKKAYRRNSHYYSSIFINW